MLFFERYETREPVIYTKHGQHRAREYSNAKLEEFVSGIRDENIYPFVISFNPHSDSGPQPLIREGSEFVYCLTGRVIYRIKGNEYILEPGDSLLFPSELAHTWENPSDETSSVVIVMGKMEK